MTQLSIKDSVTEQQINSTVKHPLPALTAKLEALYAEKKSLIQNAPVASKVFMIGMIAMLLTSHYDRYKDMLDIFSIQKKVFGDEIFSQIEQVTIQQLKSLYTLILNSDPDSGYSKLAYAQRIYATYELEYANYHYWPHMKEAMLAVIEKLSTQ